MPDILGELIRRIDALEAAVHGRASEFFQRKLFMAEVALREGRTARTIQRDQEKQKFPPPDGVNNGHVWWWLSTLEANDRAQASLPATTRRPPNAGKHTIRRAKPRKRKPATADLGASSPG